MDPNKLERLSAGVSMSGWKAAANASHRIVSSSRCSESSQCLSGKWCGLSSRLMSFISFLLSLIISLSSASQPSVLFSSAVRFPYLSSGIRPLPFLCRASPMAALAPCTRILVQYSNAAGQPWHERIILSKALKSLQHGQPGPRHLF